jgi:hypothetical protein
VLHARHEQCGFSARSTAAAFTASGYLSVFFGIRNSMKCVILVELLAVLMSHALSVLVNDRTAAQQQAIEEIHDRHHNMVTQ